MAKNNFFSRCVYGIIKKKLSLPENKSLDIGTPRKILIVRQHNQLGDLLAGVSLFRAIKEKFSASHITLIVSPMNYPGLIKNKFIDRIFVFDKRKIYNPSYFRKFKNLLKEDYDVAIVPVVVSISLTSNLIARLSNSKIRIGPECLDGIKNKSAFLFDRRVNLDWRMHPDSNVSERSLDILRPFGVNTNTFKSEITFDEEDEKSAEKFIASLSFDNDELLIGLHVGAGKIPNRWSLLKYEELMKRLNKDFKVKFYLTGSGSDKEEIDYLKKNIPFQLGTFINKTIPEVAAVISKSDLFISNDTGIMHVAGTTETPQVSIFGPTNPFNWAPIGREKYFIRKSELIDDVKVDDVYNLCCLILKKSKEENIAG
jgi:ADP-heptose:LPS heptosyltransferase